MKWPSLRLLPVLFFGVMAVFLWRGLSLEPQTLPSVQLGKPMPPFHLSVLGATNQPFTPAVMKHQVALLNVWASWCAACVEEQGFLLKLAREGIPIYGLNYKDKPEDALAWLTQWGNPYRLIGSDITGKTAIDFGVYGAPETFLIDKDGIIRYRHVGVLNERHWQKEFMPRIQPLETL